jgi:hypothetical protein
MAICIQTELSRAWLSPGEEGAIGAIPPFDVCPERIIIPANLTPNLVVTFIGIGGRSQMRERVPEGLVERASRAAGEMRLPNMRPVTELPANIFSEVGHGIAMDFETCRAKTLFEVWLRNDSTKQVHLSGCYAIFRRL